MPYECPLPAMGLLLWGTISTQREPFFQSVEEVLTASWRPSTSIAGFAFSNMAIGGITAFSSARTALMTPA